jgi:hypothetical protein
LRWLGFGSLGVLAIIAFGFLIMGLWNWLLPPLFGVPTIGYWQALGLFLLSRILLGGVGGGGHDRRSRRRLIDQWERMTPEERERFRSALRGHGPQAEDPAAPSTT